MLLIQEMPTQPGSVMWRCCRRMLDVSNHMTLIRSYEDHMRHVAKKAMPAVKMLTSVAKPLTPVAKTLHALWAKHKSTFTKIQTKINNPKLCTPSLMLLRVSGAYA